uniref:dihydrolipoamide acetyltransferase family protein n=1 Tax=Stella sp. TaxID=2912054 RepID=UPI0035B3DDB0
NVAGDAPPPVAGPEPGPGPEPPPEPVSEPPPEPKPPPVRAPAPPLRAGRKPLASPAVRRRALEAGVDLGHDDLDRFLSGGAEVAPGPGLRANETVEEVKVVGLRRRIAERMAHAKRTIAHITYVEEVDVSALEDLRQALNREPVEGRPRLTILPFLVRAIVRAVAEQPALNAHYDDEAGVIRRFGGVHVGIAAQTPGGLVVPVLRHAEARDLWNSAAEIQRLGDAAKAGTATRAELTGSTITISSLGALGGIATTPVVNPPEVAVVGVNRIQVRPHWDGNGFVPRRMMNLSSSFDHRVIDGWDAAIFVQRIKALLETPAMIFL